MRLTITRKIALTMIGVVVLSVGAMTALTSWNLQSGFIAYLNAAQLDDLEELSGTLAAAYREHGSFAWLRGDPQALRALFDQGHQQRPPPAPDTPRPRADGRRRPPPARRPPPPRANRPQSPPDPYGFGRRLTIYDENGRAVLGPPDPSPGPIRDIVVDGRSVGSVHLIPLRRVANATDQSFVRGQIRDMLLLALVLVAFSTLLAVWLARQLLHPVAALRRVTGRIAQGRFDARAPAAGSDELAELARHVNAMAESLGASERQRRKMLADVSHELRTPLSVIRGEIEALIDGIRDANPAAFGSLHEEVLRLNKLIDDLHQLALADAGDLHCQREPVDLAPLLRDLLERYKPRIQTAGLALSTAISPQALIVNADPNRLTQVLVNLLENSLRYTDSGGCIAVFLEQAGNAAMLRIEDSAPGVPDGSHARLFERLYRADQARSRVRGGSGLGLSICKALVEAHGGTVQALPSPLGGIRITICLPLG